MNSRSLNHNYHLYHQNRLIVQENVNWSKISIISILWLILNFQMFAFEAIHYIISTLTILQEFIHHQISILTRIQNFLTHAHKKFHNVTNNVIEKISISQEEIFEQSQPQIFTFTKHFHNSRPIKRKGIINSSPNESGTIINRRPLQANINNLINIGINKKTYDLLIKDISFAYQFSFYNQLIQKHQMFPHNDSINCNLILGEQFMENYYFINSLPYSQFYFIANPAYIQNAQTTECLSQNAHSAHNIIPQNLPADILFLSTADRIEIVRKKGKSPRKKTLEKQLQSAKKNSESNIVNQLYSFFNSSETSEVIISKIIKSMKKSKIDAQKIRSIFYNIVRCINLKRGRNYVNKNSILKYYTPQNFLKQMPEIVEKLMEIGIMTLDELCYIFRVSTIYFLRTISPMAILTSKRISVTAKAEHLKRRRRVINFIYGKS